MFQERLCGCGSPAPYSNLNDLLTGSANHLHWMIFLEPSAISSSLRRGKWRPAYARSKFPLWVYLSVNEALDGLLVAVSSHLRAAAEKAIIGGHPALETGGWDLHLAVECALKALLHVKSGSFPKIHPLAKLYELAKSYLPNLPNDLLERLPTAEEAIGYRYGGGRRLTLGCYWCMYQAALEIVEVGNGNIGGSQTWPGEA